MRGAPRRSGKRIKRLEREMLDLHSRADRAVRLQWRGLLPTLPTFLLVGAPQCGTTWLHVQLIRHPDVAVPRKEIRYFSGLFYHSLRWYAAYFRGVESVPARGDMSPNYIRLKPESIQLIHDLMPDARLLMILRDPVQRAFSAYRRTRPEGEEATVEHVSSFLIRNANLKFPGQVRGTEHGRYSASLVNWLGVFSREQLLVMGFDRITTDPHGVVRDALTHIGVDPGRYPWDDLSTEKVNANPPAPMPEDVRAFLSRHFDGEREAVASMLGCDPLWG